MLANLSNLWNERLNELIDKIDDVTMQHRFKKKVNALKYKKKADDDIYHTIYMQIQNYLGYIQQKNGFYEISSLTDFLSHLKELPAQRTIVFFDWDDTIVYSGTTDIIEPQATSSLFNYMLDVGIDFVFITARYWNYVLFSDLMSTDDYTDIKTSVFETMHQPLNSLGFEPEVNVVHPLRIEHNSDCVGLYYLNVLFGCEKGRIIASYLRQLPKLYDHVIFVDDYDDYLLNVAFHVPQATLIRRLIS